MKTTQFVAFIIFGLSAIVNSQKNSCSSSLNLQNSNLSIDAASLHCLAVWDTHNYILRYSQTSPNIWTFVLSTPAIDSYVAIGFSSNGQMVGWVSSSEGVITGVTKQYYLGETSPSLVEPDQGNLTVSSNSSSIISQSSSLYLVFQLETSQPLSRLIYSHGPKGELPVAPDYRLTQHPHRVSTSVNYITGEYNSTNVSFPFLWGGAGFEYRTLTTIDARKYDATRNMSFDFDWWNMESNCLSASKAGILEILCKRTFSIN